MRFDAGYLMPDGDMMRKPVDRIVSQESGAGWWTVKHKEVMDDGGTIARTSDKGMV